MSRRCRRRCSAPSRRAAAAGSVESEVLVRKVVEQAIEACTRMDAARRADGGQLRRNTIALASVAGVAVLAVLLGPAFLRSAAKALLMVSESIEAAAPYRLQVTPGNATVPKGADQAITAKLLGFTTEDVTLMARRTPTAAFEELPVIAQRGRHLRRHPVRCHGAARLLRRSPAA